MKRDVKCVYRAVLLIIAFSLIACKPRVANSPDTLIVQISNEPVSLDPSFAEDGMSFRILQNTHEGLMGSDGAGEVQFRLAESVDVSQDRKSYRFHIRKNARWSDGKPITASDFVFGMKRGLNPKNGTKLAPLFEAIQDVRDDQGDLLVTLKRPLGYFVEALSLGVVAPLRADILDANGGNWPIEAPGTGPYFIRKHVTDQFYELQRNEHYYGRKPAIQNVTLKIVADENTARELFNQKRIDILTKVPALELKKFEEQGALRVDPFYATYFVAFNTRKDPFQKAEFRRLAAASIQKKEILLALSSREPAAKSWIPMGIEGAVAFDGDVKPIEAKSKFANFKKVDAGFDSSSRNSIVLEKIQSDFKKYLGLELSLQPLDWKSYVKKIQTDAPPLYRFGWMAPFRDPISHLKAFTSNDPNNYTGWKNAEYDRLVEEIAGLEKGPERLKKILRAQSILTDDEAVVVPIYHYIQTHAFQPRVVGFRANPFAVIRFDEISFKP